MKIISLCLSIAFIAFCFWLSLRFGFIHADDWYWSLRILEWNIAFFGAILVFFILFVAGCIWLVSYAIYFILYLIRKILSKLMHGGRTL